jgi:uncharacterized protein
MVFARRATLQSVSGQVLELHRFAVKSMLGESLEHCAIDEVGLRGDRVYALLDEDTAMVASAKRPRLWAGLLDLAASFAGQAGRSLPVVVERKNGEKMRSDTGGFDSWLSAAIGRQVKLIAQPAAGASYEDEWPAIEGLAPDEFINSTRTSTSDDGLAVSALPVGMMAPGTFQDVAPVTILTTASLRAANRLHASGDWDPRRFRPNLLLEVPGEGFMENEWAGRRLTVGEAVLEVTAPTPRCVMTTLAQQGLPADRAVLRTLATDNRVEVSGFGRFACLGAYASVVTPGVVSVGDACSVA